MGQTLRGLIVFVVGCTLLVEGQRIAVKKCSEYREGTLVRSKLTTLPVLSKILTFENFNCSKTVDLIVGGVAARKGEFPHQALLGWPRYDHPQVIDFHCGGSLISKRYVLTAAHCFKNGYPTVVRLGEQNLDALGNEVDVAIDSIQEYPEYSFKAVYHDIALIRLQENVRFSKYIRPACLWTALELNVTSVIASGFGNTESLADRGSPILRKVKLDLLNKEKCFQQFMGSKGFRRGLIIDGQICVGSNIGGRDACQGDSGGPIQVITESKGCVYHVVGITSVGSSCGVSESPAIYTRVASYIDWIEKNVWSEDLEFEGTNST